MNFARLTAPHLTRRVTAECEPGVRACFDALAEVDGAGKAVADAGVPVMIWEGAGEPAHDQRKAFADASGIRFLSTGGDHLGMVFAHGKQSAAGIRAFVDEVGASEEA